ncbi:type III secretion system chaperone [Mailhella sp.]|uniref:type III secretion system chaperone n=1 Tax=Mailhella sp. TaxID=1981029 RepID=UPI004063D093
MQKRFVELVSAFLAEAGIECPVVPGENIVTVPVGDFSFNIGLLESRGAVVMQGAAGVVPPSGREAFYAELLRMNSLFKGTNGAAFGLEDDTVTMQSFIPMEGITQDAFSVQAVTFLEALATAMEGFDAIAERASSDAPETSGADILAMQNMLRI